MATLGVGNTEDAEWRYWLTEAGAANVDSSQGQFFTLANLSLEAALTHQGVAIGRASLISDWLQGDNSSCHSNSRSRARCDTA